MRLVGVCSQGPVIQQPHWPRPALPDTDLQVSALNTAAAPPHDRLILMHTVTFAASLFFFKKKRARAVACMMVVVVASNLMRRVFVLFNNVRVACSVVGNPMICGSNAGAGECAAALPPVTVPFPLESTPGGSSEHSSFLPLCLSFISTASQAGQLARLASRAQCFSALSRSAWRGVHACVAAAAAAAAFVPLPRRGSGRGDTVLSAWGRRRSRLRPGIPVVGCM
jgi:hypothetical protein